MPDAYPPHQYVSADAAIPSWAEDLLATTASVGRVRFLDWRDSSTRSLVAALAPEFVDDWEDDQG